MVSSLPAGFPLNRDRPPGPRGGSHSLASRTAVDGFRGHRLACARAEAAGVSTRFAGTLWE